MSTTTPFNLTIVLPPNRQYYVSYFYPYEYHNNSIDQPITGNIYRVPFIFDYNVQFQFGACTYFVFSWYEGNELKYFVYAIDKYGGHSGSTYETYDYRQNIVTDEYGSLLVYVGFLNDYAMQVYAPGRKICNYTLGINDALFRVSPYDKGASDANLNNFPYDVLVNGYYVVTYPNDVIDGTYQLQDGCNVGYKIPELTNGTLKHGLGQISWFVSQTDDYITIYRFKFTTANDSIKTLYRIMHFTSSTSDNGDLNSLGDLWIDPDTKELKIWANNGSEPIVLKQLPDDALYAWHELAIPWETYGDLKGFYWDGEYIDLLAIYGRTAYATFRKTILAGFPEIDGGFNEVDISRLVKNKPILLDYAALHINSNSYPYVMEDNYFNYYDPILPEPEPEPTEPEEEEPKPEKPKNNKYAELWRVLSYFSYPVQINHFPFKHRR